MRKVAAGVEAQSHEGVARLKQSKKHRLIGLRAGMWLHIREFAGEQLFGSRDRAIFRNIDKLATTVISTAGIAFGVFVRKHRALCLKHRARDDIFGGDKFDVVLLTAKLLGYALPNLRIGLHQMCRKEAGLVADRRARGLHADPQWKRRSSSFTRPPIAV